MTSTERRVMGEHNRATQRRAVRGISLTIGVFSFKNDLTERLV